MSLSAYTITTVGLRLLLTNSHYLQLFLPKDRADAFISGWKDGSLKGVVTGDSLPVEDIFASCSWALDMKDLVAIHTVNVEKLVLQARAQAGQYPANFPNRGSGYNTRN